MNLDEIYTPLEEAKEEIQRRWEDKELKKKVDEFLGGDIPDFLLDSPKAYLARHVASPNFEFFRFLEQAHNTNMDYIVPEYLNDKFHPANSMKYHLGRIFIYNGKNKNGGHNIESETIIDFNKSNGKKFTEMVTMWDENFVDFHHRILKDKVCDSHLKVCNMSDWIKKMGDTPEKFYVYFLALFIRNGILFENFLNNNEERMFTLENVIPSLKILLKKFGVKPLIVRLVPKETEEDIYWLCYNNSVKDHLK
jgi:hypothetical protein